MPTMMVSNQIKKASSAKKWVSLRPNQAQDTATVLNHKIPAKPKTIEKSEHVNMHQNFINLNDQLDKYRKDRIARNSKKMVEKMKTAC